MATADPPHVTNRRSRRLTPMFIIPPIRRGSAPGDPVHAPFPYVFFGALFAVGAVAALMFLLRAG